MTDTSIEPEQENAQSPDPRGRQRLRLVLFIVGLSLLLSGGGWYYRHVIYGQYMQSTDNAYVAADSVVVSSKIGGYVEEVFARENCPPSAPMAQI